MFSTSQYEEELYSNIQKILAFAKKCDLSYAESLNIIKDGASEYAEADYETRLIMNSDLSFESRMTMPFNKGPEYIKACSNPYFFHCQDPANSNYYYISNSISLENANILKYTQARAIIRYIGDDRTFIYINQGKITLVIPDIDKKEYQSITDKSNLLRKELTRKDQVIGNIANTLINEQDTAMRNNADKVIIITGPAGSGKTNAILHRIDYLISETDIEAKEIALFCYNIGLKKYLQSSLKGIIQDNINIYSIDKWAEDIIRETFGVSKKARFDIEDIEAKKYGYIIPKGYDWKNYNQQLKDDTRLTETQKENRSKANYKITKEINNANDQIKKEFSVEYKYKVDLKLSQVKKFFENTNNIDISCIYRYKENGIFIIDYIGIYQLFCQTNNLTFNESDFRNPDIRFILACFIKQNYPENLLDYLGPKNKYKHILIDEFQDIDQIKLYALKQITNGGMTISGDITQSIFKNPQSGDIDIGFPYDNIETLTVSHRGTKETICFANALFGKKGIEKNLSQYVTTSGDKPIICKSLNNDILIRFLKGGIEKYPTASFLVCCPTEQACEDIYHTMKNEGIQAYIAKKDTWNFDKQIHIATYQGIKGLEFDFVFMLGIEDFLQWNLSNQINIIYTVITRARMRVLIFSQKESPKIDSLLGKVDNSLYELKEY